eukprot:Skav204399  [mRNA]  locus=scaffold2947:214261:214899:+ [translate_table: standard]
MPGSPARLTIAGKFDASRRGFSSAVANAENGMQTFRRRAQPRVAGAMLPTQCSGRFSDSGRVKKIVKRYEGELHQPHGADFP